MNDLVVRLCTGGDVDAYCSLYARAFPDLSEMESRRKAMLETVDDPLYSMDTHLLAFSDGVLAGSILSKLDPAYIDRNGGCYPYITLMVDAGMRRMGVATVLLESLESVLWGRVQGIDAFASLESEAVMGFLAARGFEMVGNGYCKMERPLDDGESIPGAGFPGGFSIRKPVLPDEIPLIVDAMNESFSTNPNHVPFTIPYVSTRPYILAAGKGGGFMLEKDGRVAATVFNTLEEYVEEGERELMGGIYALGVSSKYRGLGLGRALLSLSLAWMLEKGCRKAYLYMSRDNKPARSIYDSMGFRTTEEGARYRKML